jgi:hypothetical protein
MAIYDDFGLPYAGEGADLLSKQQRGIAKRVSDAFDSSREIYNRQANQYSLPAMGDFNRDWAVERAKAMAGYSTQGMEALDPFGLYKDAGLGGRGGTGTGGGRSTGGGGGSSPVYRYPTETVPRSTTVRAPAERSTADNLGTLLGLGRMLFGMGSNGQRGYQDAADMLRDLGLMGGKNPARFPGMMSQMEFDPYDPALAAIMGPNEGPTSLVDYTRDMPEMMDISNFDWFGGGGLDENGYYMNPEEDPWWMYYDQGYYDAGVPYDWWSNGSWGE